MLRPVTVSKNISRERTTCSPNNFGLDPKNIKEGVTSIRPMESTDARRPGCGRQIRRQIRPR